MIFDSIDNFQAYLGVHPGFADVQTFLSETDLSALATGEHKVNNKGGYASVNEYDTRSIDDCFIECHQKYIDVQTIAWGEEKIGVIHKGFCEEFPYDEEKDLQKLSGRVDFITLVPGLFAVFFPHDAHEPCVRSRAEAARVKKIVFKIPV